MKYGWRTPSSAKMVGTDGYWPETRVADESGAGTNVKGLIVIEGNKPVAKRVIAQRPREPPMEMPMNENPAGICRTCGIGLRL